MSRKLDVSGAAASSAGDAFHEVWALLQALKLLDRDTDLSEMVLEGIRDAAPTDDEASWDGIDCALYYDWPAGASGSRVDLVQLKYSVTGAKKNWTPARFLASTSAKSNNSVARRLANAFKRERQNRTAAQTKGSVTVTLLSNQPMSEALREMVSKVADGLLGGQDLASLKAATGLSKADLKLFCQCLRLKGGAGTNADLNSDLVQAVANLLEGQASDMVSNLRMQVRDRMLTQGDRRIDRNAALALFGVADIRSLFPCEPRLEPIAQCVHRQVMDALAAEVVQNGFVCLHGEGGCGKTTTVQALAPLLPEGSKVIVYDCYGAGRYRDRSEPRHRPLEAFKQLSNELARTTGAPLFFPYTYRDDMASVFASKLRSAAALFEASNPGALLVIAIDAADNSVHASRLPASPEHCFVHDLVTFQDIPGNVRLLISARSARREDLKLPEHAAQILCTPFSQSETGAFLNLHGLSGTVAEMEDFHHLTHGVARVQTNALKAADSLAAALTFLRPHGQSLDDLFYGVIKDARDRAGVEASIEQVCAGLSQTPAPSPATYLSNLWGLPEAVCADFLSDLRPNLRVSAAGAEFANEDFEAYCEEAGARSTEATRRRLADLLFQDRLTDEYAAVHLFDLLVATGDKDRLKSCLEEADATSCIRDPVKRRHTDLNRLRGALHIAARQDNAVEMARTICLGAESVRTARIVQTVMRDNPDLSAAFVADTIDPLILFDPAERAHQGPLLMHHAREFAIRDDRSAARSNLRAADEWLHQKYNSGDDNRSWRLSIRDIVAAEYAVWKLHGAEAASRSIDRWVAIETRIEIWRHLTREIALRDGPDPLRNLFDTGGHEVPIFAFNALVRSGAPYTESDATRALACLAGLDPKRLGTVEATRQGPTEQQVLLDEYFFACETAARYSGLQSDAANLAASLHPASLLTLEFASSSSPYTMDLAFRSVMLRARSESRAPAVVGLIEKPEAPQEPEREGKAWEIFQGQHSRYEIFLPCARIYDALHTASLTPSPNTISDVITAYSAAARTLNRPFEYHSLRQVIGRRMLDLCAMHALDENIIESILSRMSVDAEDFGDTHSAWYQDLLHNPARFDLVLRRIMASLEAARQSTRPATDKAENFIAAARAMLPLNRPSAETFYLEALEIVEGIDFDMLDLLQAFCRILAQPAPDTPDRRRRANRFATVLYESGRMFQNEEAFPQSDAVRALTLYSPAVAAAQIARWSDDGFGSAESDLNTFLETSVETGALSVEHAALLNAVRSNPNPKFHERLADAASVRSKRDRTELVNHLAMSALSGARPGVRLAASTPVGSLVEAHAADSAAARQFMAVREFQDQQPSVFPEPYHRNDDPWGDATPKAELVETWTGLDPFDPDAIVSGRQASLNARFYDHAAYYEFLRSRVAVSRRTQHLDALAVAARGNERARYEIEALIAALRDWHGPSTGGWSRENVPPLLRARGPQVLGFGWKDPEPPLAELLKFSGLSRPAQVKLLAEIVESAAPDFDARDLLRLLAELVCRMELEDAEVFLDWCLDRTETRLRLDGGKLARFELATDSIPSTGEDITAALLCRFLGDIDADIRWRATHVIRHVSQQGGADLLRRIVRFAISPEASDYTFRDCPFHQLSAALQIAIGFARIAFETPEIIAELEPDAVALWQASKPHFLIGHFIARAFIELKERGRTLSISDANLQVMTGASTPLVPKSRERRRLRQHEREGERFQFDSMDTIPYWYNPAIEIFADLPGDEFLASAERFIVDHWGGHETSSHWDKEPRPTRFQGDYESYSNRHGSLPRLFRHSLYLQFHAMFCAVGELKDTHAFAEWKDEDTYGTIGDWLRHYDTTYSGAWLSELRSLPPLEPRYWALPDPSSEDWVKAVETIDLIQECFSECGQVCLASYRTAVKHHYDQEEARERVRVESAFIVPATAGALLRAYSAMTDWRDMYLPTPDRQDRLHGLSDRFRLLESTDHPREHNSPGLDEQDPDRFSVSGVRYAPSRMLASTLNIPLQPAWRTQWTSPHDPSVNISYQAWSSQPVGSLRRHFGMSSVYITDGDRLCIAPSLLSIAIDRLERDLIFMIDLRRSTGTEYARQKGKSPQEKFRTLPVLFRKNGKIETVEGPAGTWK